MKKIAKVQRYLTYAQIVEVQKRVDNLARKLEHVKMHAVLIQLVTKVEDVSFLLDDAIVEVEDNV